MKKIIKLTESDLTRIVKRVVKENEEKVDYTDDDTFHEDSELLMIEVIDKIKPFYLKYGLEDTKFFLESILNGIHDVGDEYFGEEENF